MLRHVFVEQNSHLFIGSYFSSLLRVSLHFGFLDPDLKNIYENDETKKHKNLYK